MVMLAKAPMLMTILVLSPFHILTVAFASSLRE